LEFEYLKSLPLRQKKTFTIVSIGRLLQWKGFHLALQAFAQFCGSHRESEYWIIGDGPEKGRLQKLASNHGLEKSVRFLGRLTRREVLRRLGDCDVLVHPSLHDSGGTVCVEAMAAGRPIICLECGGAKQLVPTEAGIKVVPQDTTQTVRELRNAIEKLAQDFDLRLKMGEAGRRHISTYHRWHSKGELLQKLVLDLQLQ
jgi:glycosyltransferase involved in cell wall biosynthesis